MAPAGSFESLRAAIKAGCDSVYFGVDQLNMRSRSANFMFKDLIEVARVCREAGVKSYLTLNTLLYDHDMALMKKIVDAVKEAGVDSVIVSDFAAIQYARFQGVNVHISTQVSISNIETAKFFSQYSDKIVLARELSLPLVKKLHEEIIAQDVRGPSGELVEIEAFAHGAMCVAVSGRCHMSLFTDNASANRGACIQNCRKAYIVEDHETGQKLKIDNQFVMSPEDLCTIDFLDKLIDAGVHTFKIEGRGRSPDYVYTVIKAYREALDSISDSTYSKEKIEKWFKDMKSVYNRGLSSGYYLGRHMKSWSGAYGSKATKEKIKLGRIKNYYKKAKVAFAELDSGELSLGDEILITGPTTGVVKGEVKSLMVDDDKVDIAKKGALITFSLGELVRPSDSLFKVVLRK